MGVIAFDTETRGLNAWDPNEQAFLASWADDKNEYVADLTTAEGKEAYISALRDAEVLVAHNLSFDVHQTRESTGYDIIANGTQVHDTDLMSRVMHPEGQSKGQRGGHSLKNLATTYVDPNAKDAENVLESLAKALGHRTLKKTGVYYDIWRAYPDELEHYARLDARYTYDLYKKFNGELSGATQRCYELERAVAPVLIRAEQRGIALDKAAVTRLRSEYESRQIGMYEHLEAELGTEALGGVGSEEALLEALQAIGVPLYRKTPTGQLATSKFALQEFEDDYPVLGDLQELRRLEKFLSTYIGPMVGREVVHTSFRQCEAWTGRMSSTRPNMQNVPKRAGKEIRSMFVPREGHAFVVMDYEAIEIRLLAYYLADESYKQIIRDGLDPHAWMAASIWGGAVEDYSKDSAKRTAAKNVLFAITYGAGGRRLTDMLKLDPADNFAAGKALAAKVKSALPGYHRLNKRIRAKIESEGHVTTLFGRKQLVNRDKSYVGLNALIQGSAADLMKQGLVNVAELIEPYDGVPLLVVHDEVVVEVPLENAEPCQYLVKTGMEKAYDLDPPLSVEGGIVTTNYSEA